MFSSGILARYVESDLIHLLVLVPLHLFSNKRGQYKEQHIKNAADERGYKEVMMKSISDKKLFDFYNRILLSKFYYVQLLLFSIIGLIIIYYRSRLGVDLTDETWYSSDPYWVAKSSIPYVNNWTQASGFTIPLNLFFSLFLSINGSTAGIILFSRTLFCFWKAIISLASFILLYKAGNKIPALLVIPVIVFAPVNLFNINYNTIGWSYMLLALAVLYNAMDRKRSNRQKLWLGGVAGIIIGRAVIGTLASVLICIVVLMMLIIKRDWIALKGTILGGIIAALIVITYCSIRGGFAYFVMGIQYFVKDQAYFDSVSSHKVPFAESTAYLFQYMRPALISLLSVILLRAFLRKRLDIFNKLMAIFFGSLLSLSVFYLSKYDGSIPGLVSATKYGWFIPLLSLFLDGSPELKNKFKYAAYITLSYVGVYIFQGYTSNYGFETRCYWNLIPLILSVYIFFICINEVLGIKRLAGARAFAEMATCFCIAFFVARGAYWFVYRDMPYQQLDTKVKEGIWKGCYTTSERADTVVQIEKEMKDRTTPDDQVLCYGNWPCFLNLLSDGQLCAPNAIGTGQKNGFDYWHMYQKVPTKVFVHVDVEDVQGRMTSAYDLWNFIDEFYQQSDEFYYTSYDENGSPTYYRIIELEITDYEAALAYADEKATKIFEPGR